MPPIQAVLRELQPLLGLLQHVLHCCLGAGEQQQQQSSTQSDLAAEWAQVEQELLSGYKLGSEADQPKVCHKSALYDTWLISLSKLHRN